MKMKILSLAMLCASCTFAGPVMLAPGVWQTEPFTTMNAGDFFPTAYQVSSGEVIDITGYYVTGDYYGVYVNGNLVTTTTQVTPTGVDYGDQTPALYADPASAFSSGLFSTGQFRVNAGDLITISDLYPPNGIGEVGIEAVPEPATFVLLGLGLALCGVMRRAKSPAKLPVS